MKTVTISLPNAIRAYKQAPDSFKDVLSSLIPEVVSSVNLDVRERIKTYEDACEDQGITPLQLSDFNFLPEKDREYHFFDHQSVIIKRALNEGWEPDFDNHDERKYYVWYEWVGSGAGFSFLGYDGGLSSSFVGARHQFKSYELAEYFAKQFIGIVNATFIIKKSN